MKFFKYTCGELTRGVTSGRNAGLTGDIVRVGSCGILELRTESCAGLITALPVALRESSSGDYRVPRPRREPPVMNFILPRT